jgi:type I restriction enzyme R subunit
VRDFRRQQTPAERALWKLIRDRRLEGLKFRRQFPITIFVADFCCLELKLIVELDGGVHETASGTAHDANRDFYLRSLGYTILRFPNAQVFADPAAVLQRIAAEARRLQSESGSPSPLGEGDRG